MRGRLTAIALLTATFACVYQVSANEEERDNMTLTVALEAPMTAPLMAITPDSPDYNPVKYNVRLSFSNPTSMPKTFPGLAIVRSTVREYRNTRSGNVQSFTIGEPPSLKPELITLAPGKSWSYGIGLEYPAELLQSDRIPIILQLCASWSRSQLDSRIYGDVAFDWAKDFRVCQQIEVVP
ncbi:MAG: hypothetical protein ABJN34_05130 [Litoreibacter sp.]|uniref:hypothetical protein n=1 Tax=Litoreibacter sp. TaxID=1969459 RepID=UPI00329A4077